MKSTKKAALLERILARAADSGDPTKPVLERFFAAYPEARTPFIRFEEDQASQLQAAMVEQAIYCVMTWYESPREVQIFLQSTVPHHLETLHVPPDLFEGLLAVTIDVIADSVPTESSNEHELLRDLLGDLTKTVRASE